MAIKFKPVQKDRLFYSQYRYCLSFCLQEANVLKNLDSEYINAVIARKIEHREYARERWLVLCARNPKVYQVMSENRWQEITPQMIEDILTVAAVLRNTKVDFKLVTSSNTGYVYTNSVSLIIKLNKHPTFDVLDIAEAVISREKDTIKLRDPKHTNRSYFKSVKLTANEKQNLADFLIQHQDIRISPSTLAWIDKPYARTQDHFFIDHDGEAWLLLLALVRPGLIRKTITIVPA